MQKCVPKLVFKFHDDPTVNEFKIVVLLEHIWMYAGKIESFGRGRRENEFEKKRECKDVS